MVYTSCFGKIKACSSLKNKKIHIICGGGSAVDTINLLYNSNAGLSLGILNIGDSDHLTAKKYNLEIIEVEPFSYIKEESILKLRRKLNEVDNDIMSKKYDEIFKKYSCFSSNYINNFINLKKTNQYTNSLYKSS